MNLTGGLAVGVHLQNGAAGCQRFGEGHVLGDFGAEDGKVWVVSGKLLSETLTNCRTYDFTVYRNYGFKVILKDACLGDQVENGFRAPLVRPAWLDRDDDEVTGDNS
jgi:hypothetical protein